MQITLQTFGAFRQFGQNIALELSADAKVADIRAPLIAALAEFSASFDIAGLVDSSRFATETEILAEDVVLKSGSLITILPPVSGG
ncbi:MAG: MoaD/ThiS family protein [Alphaproteobacteria bacterium]|nr:MoaD/ThiS family protein [Alphaproteobacteria bacterium]